MKGNRFQTLAFRGGIQPHPSSRVLPENLGLDLGQSLMHRAKRESQFLSNNFPGGLNPKVSGRQCGLLVLFFILLLLFFAPPPSSLNTSSLKAIKPVSQMQYGGFCFFIC